VCSRTAARLGGLELRLATLQQIDQLRLDVLLLRVQLGARDRELA